MHMGPESPQMKIPYFEVSIQNIKDFFFQNIRDSGLSPLNVISPHIRSDNATVNICCSCLSQNVLNTEVTESYFLWKGSVY